MPRPRPRHAIALATLLAICLIPAEATQATTVVPKLPTQLTGRKAVQVRPAVISFTGDGTGILGGFTSRSSVRMPSREGLSWAGRLHWTSWNTTRARAAGAVWLNNGIPDDAEGTFYPYATRVTATRPRDGIFTRLTFSYRYNGRGELDRLKADYVPPENFGNGYTAPGFWQWQAAGLSCLNTCP